MDISDAHYKLLKIEIVPLSNHQLKGDDYYKHTESKRGDSRGVLSPQKISHFYQISFVSKPIYLKHLRYLQKLLCPSSILTNVRNDIYPCARLTEDFFAQMYNKFNNSLQRKLTFAIQIDCSLQLKNQAYKKAAIVYILWHIDKILRFEATSSTFHTPSICYSWLAPSLLGALFKDGTYLAYIIIFSQLSTLSMFKQVGNTGNFGHTPNEGVYVWHYNKPVVWCGRYCLQVQGPTLSSFSL